MDAFPIDVRYRGIPCVVEAIVEVGPFENGEIGENFEEDLIWELKYLGQ